MDTAKLKKFAQQARRMLMEQIASRLSFVLEAESPARREAPKSVKDLEKQIADSSRESVIEKTAYIWFNRFCALRFMDVNRYTRIGTVSPAEGFTQPEILMEAKQGHIDDGFSVDRDKVFDLLNGVISSPAPQQEAYRLLLVAACNYYNRIMPFLFERIADYTELLMPDDLLSESSILSLTIEALSPEACENVEVIGWLYQFYISEKKDEVFDGLKKNKKITPENIPAATQLFTPDWIVRYLVENSLGRLWMLNKPGSRLAQQMEYYIKPEHPETDFLKISSPEEIKICDPACGSGHMLVYAFDLLYSIYEEEGYDGNVIPGLILENNLYGIEIDERAGELAAFALTMKAREKYRRFFNKPVQPNICVLENVQFKENELNNYMEAIGRDLFTSSFQATMRQFEEADNFGSLIRPAMKDAGHIYNLIKEKNISGQLLLHVPHQKVLKVLKQADYLSQKYHVVIANPPYMGGKGMNGRLGDWVKDNYPDSKSDLFAMFIERNLDLALKKGSVAMITMQSWMFLSSFEKLRSRILDNETILSMAHIGARGFDSIGGEVVSTTAFVLGNFNNPIIKGGFCRLVDGNSEKEKNSAILEAVKNPDCGWFFRASASDFKKIPGSPIAYWVSENARCAFDIGVPLTKIAEPRVGLDTGDNDRFLRLWHEANFSMIGFGFSDIISFHESNHIYVPHTKGGNFRKWAGNYEYVLKFDVAAYNQLSISGNHLPSRQYYFRDGANWTRVSSGLFGIRYTPVGFVFNSACPTIFAERANLFTALGFLLSPIAIYYLSALSPTLNFQAGEIRKLPIIDSNVKNIESVVSKLINIAHMDWNEFETSWDFLGLSLILHDNSQVSLKNTYTQIRIRWHERMLEMQRLEEENNRIFIEAYGLQDELTPEVPLKEITLTCNPHYRYGGDKTEEELEALLLADTIKEYISYAVGCMLGRYSIDKPGLILANQGETIKNYLDQIPEPTFEPDEDNVIPILDEGWFSDDITERFKKFLKVTFGEENYEINLKFIEDAIGKDIRKYFLKDFYSDHVKRYKKRPIYWLFSSPKGSFNALIYMHRYQPDTASIVLNEYLREFRAKLSARKEHQEAISISSSASQKEKTQALKDIEKLKKTIEELDEYEREILYPLATRQINIDLDDGVKVNYQKFGTALKKIPGLEANED